MNKTTETYSKIRRKKRIFILISAVLLILMIFVALGLGAVKISPSDIFQLLRNDQDSIAKNIIWNIRLPRILSACLVGMGLSVSGAVMQSLLRNPLGSPFTLGISHAAAFGASLAIFLFQTGTNGVEITDTSRFYHYGLVSLSAFVFSLISTFIILSISKLKKSSPEVLILSGIAVGSIFSAGIAAIQFFATEIQLSSIVFWTFGDFGRAAWKEFIILLIVSLPVLLYFSLNSWNFLSLDAGDETARSLGVKADKIRLQGMVLASLLCAVAISFYGIIAFVGLVVPHMIRSFVGANERFVIPASLLFGGFFLLFADTVARIILSPQVLAVGILTSFLGAPLFIFLIIKRKQIW